MNFKQFLIESAFDLNAKRDCTFGDLLSQDSHLKEGIQEMLMEEEHGPDVYKKLLACKMSYNKDVKKGRSMIEALHVLDEAKVAIIMRFSFFKTRGFDSSTYAEMPIFIVIDNGRNKMCYSVEYNLAVRSGQYWDYAKIYWHDARHEVYNTTHNYDMYKGQDPTTMPDNHNAVYAWIPFV